MRLQHHISQNAIGVLDTVYDSVFVGCLKYSTLFMALSLPFHHWLGMCIRAWLDYICTSLIIGKLAYHIKEQQKNRHAVRAWHCEVTCDYDIAQICVISVRSSKKKKEKGSDVGVFSLKTLLAAPIWWMELDSPVKYMTFVFCWLLVRVLWREVIDVESFLTGWFITWIVIRCLGTRSKFLSVALPCLPLCKHPLWRNE